LILPKTSSRPRYEPNPCGPRAPRRGALTAIALVSLLALAGCGSVEENPLGVNTAAEPQAQAAGPDTSGGGEVVPIGSDLGDDPLNVGLDGAELCGVQPEDSRLRYTVMLHNPTLETFTFGDMALGNPEGLTIISSMVQTANREGHHHPTAPGGAHEEHSAAPTTAPAEEPEPIGPPVPAAGYQFVPDAHVNVIVTVELAEGVTHGSADNIVVAYATPEREYAVPHNLSIDVDATSCS
jgi:hypothetical protein